MKTSRIWRNCFLKFLDTPPFWKNPDLNDSGRDDVFWVICPANEVKEKIIPYIKSDSHKEIVAKQSCGHEQSFLVSRHGLVQYYPYLVIHDFSFEKIEEWTFSDIKELETFME